MDYRCLLVRDKELPGLPDGEPGSRAVRVEFDSPEDAAFAKDKLDGKKALSKKLVVLFEKDSRLVSDKEKVRAIGYNTLSMLTK